MVGARVLLAALIMALTGCLYTFQAGSGFPSHVRTLAVIPFDYVNPLFDLSQELHSLLL